MHGGLTACPGLFQPWADFRNPVGLGILQRQRRSVIERRVGTTLGLVRRNTTPHPPRNPNGVVSIVAWPVIPSHHSIPQYVMHRIRQLAELDASGAQLLLAHELCYGEHRGP